MHTFPQLVFVLVRYGCGVGTGMREVIGQGLCPFCSGGPFRSLGAHTAHAHQVTARELRQMAGLPLDAVLTSPEYHEERTVHALALDLTPMQEAAAKVVKLPRARTASDVAADRKRAARVETYRALHDLPDSMSPAEVESFAAKARRPDRKVSERRARDLRIMRLYGEGSTFRDIGKDVGLDETYVARIVRRRTPGVRAPRPPRLQRPPVDRRCGVEGCDRAHKAHGYCNEHYRRWRIENGLIAACTEPDCEAPSLARGLCNKHYLRNRA